MKNSSTASLILMIVLNAISLQHTHGFVVEPCTFRESTYHHLKKSQNGFGRTENKALGRRYTYLSRSKVNMKQEDIQRNNEQPVDSIDPSETSAEQELENLRSEIASKRLTTSSETSRDVANGKSDPFIPIFTAISLAGLFGAYGYEMIRLYIRGELYLPWD
jgi:hypothetical protein